MKQDSKLTIELLIYCSWELNYNGLNYLGGGNIGSFNC